MHPHSVEYKKRLIKTWDEIALRYHKRWAKKSAGPFQSTAKLVGMTRIGKGDKVLDLACGTGAVTKKILIKIGKGGHVIGIDSSSTAIKIAKRWAAPKSNIDFVVSDAETLHFNEKFDAVTCHYALFFFPNAPKVLQNAKRCLKKNGTLALAVHGAGNTVPYFSSILGMVTKFIPDYLPLGTPDLDRFGTRTKLRAAIRDAGFTNIRIKEFTFSYSPGTFSRYWGDYLKYLANPLKEKINSLPHAKRKQMRDQIKQKTLPYTKNGKITFPWKVLILTATKP
ncbi:MAG: methyltransferase domain-containing protein [Candidatus Nitrosotenuis sp.]